MAMVSVDATVKEEKQTKGRRKIEMKLIKDVASRNVCFSKRRVSLFTKATELSILCGAEFATVVFSPAGNPFSFGHPSFSAVVDRFLTATADPTPRRRRRRRRAAADDPTPADDARDFNQRHAALVEAVEAERRFRKALEAFQEAEVSIEGLGIDELQRYLKSLEELMMQVEMRTRAAPLPGLLMA